MRKKSGIVCMIIGAVLIISAFSLLIFNISQTNRAEKSSAKVVSQLKDSITDSDNNKKGATARPGVSTKNVHMIESEIEDYSYIGYLSIPSQGLELPVMSEWDYQRLRISPCRYSGTIKENNLVIIAHNYSSHFGNIDQLQSEDEVLFTDINGEVTTYQVDCIDVVPPNSVEEVVSGNSDLALVTCTYSGKTRVVVYCDKK